MGLSEDAHDAGQEVASATEATLPDILTRALRRFLGWPYHVSSGRVVDKDGNRAECFASVVHTASASATASDPDEIPADTAAAVIDACERLDVNGLRAGYRRIAQAKRLRKHPPPCIDGVPVATTTLGIILGLRSDLALDDLADELDRLNAQTPGRERPDMVAVASTGTVSYAIQFPGESVSGDWLPPAEEAFGGCAPPMYVVMIVRATGAYTFNRMLGFLIAHLFFFSPGAKLPDATRVLEGVPHLALTGSGYQYNLSGDLLPVPRQLYSDRYLPPLPWRIEDQCGELLSTLEFLPWQDGGVVLLRGKLPLDGLLVFLGKEALGRAGLRVFRRPDAQLSYVLPITQRHFNELLARIQRQTNMVVRRAQPKLVLQKIADEGSRSPFVARLFMGILRLRNAIYTDPAERQDFDKSHEFVTSSLWNARASAQAISTLWEGHVRTVTSGEIARLQGQTIHISESVDRELRKHVEDFLNAAVRALKQGMQDLAEQLQVDIGFLFRKDDTFGRGLAALETADPALAAYLRQTRTWSERLVESRNAIEHKSWALPRVAYSHTGGRIGADEPSISGQPVTEFARFILDRVLCFVEEITVRCLQGQLPAEITITEIPLTERLAEAPQRFTLTPAKGGRPAWQIAHHDSAFEET